MALCYTTAMAKKIALASLAEQMQKGFALIEKRCSGGHALH